MARKINETKKDYLSNLKESREESSKVKRIRRREKKINSGSGLKEMIVNDAEPILIKDINEVETRDSPIEETIKILNSLPTDFTEPKYMNYRSALGEIPDDNINEEESEDENELENEIEAALNSTQVEYNPTTYLNHKYKQPLGSTSDLKSKSYPYISLLGNNEYLVVSRNISVRITHNNFFSCGIQLFGEIEKVYRNYGIEEVKNVINIIINDFNKIYYTSAGSERIFGLFSITDRYEELVNYFYSIAETASDFEKNPNSDNRIIIFTLKLKLK